MHPTVIEVTVINKITTNRRAKTYEMQIKKILGFKR
jgi:hypothetical protein